MQSVEAFKHKLEQEIPLTLQIEELRSGVYRLYATDKTPLYFYSSGKYIPETTGPGIHIEAKTWESKPIILMHRIHTAWGFSKRFYARQTTCKRITSPISQDFQRAHHMLVPLRGKYRYGLYRGEELVSIAVFSGFRKMGKTTTYRSIELLRFCHKDNYLVIGGLSKLISHMWRELQPDDLMTYIDQKWSNGHKFEQVGFQVVGKYQDPDKNIYSLKLILKKDARYLKD